MPLHSFNMRIVLMIMLGVSICMALPQGGHRTRLRGSRRFALASPAIPTLDEASIAEEEISQKTITTTVQEAPARSRTPQLRRRGNASLRLRNRTPVQQTPSEIAIVDDTVSSVKTESPKTPVSGGRRGGIRIRRPTRRRKTTPATTTTTTTEVPELETPTQEVMTMNVTKQEVVDKPITTTTLAASTTIPTEAPRKKKFRPIPIKIGRRRQGGSPKQKSSVPAPVPVTQKSVQLSNAQPKTNQTPRHRLDFRNRNPLRSRVRSRRPTSKPEIKEKVEIVDDEVKQVETVTPAPIRKSVRARTPLLRRKPSRRRLPSRTRTKKITEEIKAKEIPQTDLIPEEVEVLENKAEIRSDFFGNKMSM